MITRIVLLSFFIAFVLNLNAQQASGHKADLDVIIMPAQLDEELDPSNTQRLEIKVRKIFSRYNTLDKSGSTFALYPRLDVFDFGELEGIQVSQTVSLEMNFLVKNVYSGQVFSVFSRKISGAGKTQKEAVKNALSNIKTNQKIYSKYIAELKKDIADYFEAECSNIIAEVNTATENKEYEKAISLLYTLPSYSDCRKANETLLNQTYLAYQSQNCQNLTQKAEVAILKKDYKDAIDLLGQVDPQSPCKEKSQELLNTVSEKVDEQTAKKMAFLNKVYQDNVAIEKVRQESMKSISNTYIEGIKKD